MSRVKKWHDGSRNFDRESVRSKNKGFFLNVFPLEVRIWFVKLNFNVWN